jgi:hypothetical protein
VTITANVGLIKLARTLRVPVERFDYLADVPEADIAAFRQQVADMLFEYQSRRLAGIAAAARVLPGPVVAKLVRLKPNALLTAGAAGVMEPAHAVDIAKRLPAAFLAEVAAQLDSRRTARIIGKLPTKVVVQVAEEVARREDWMTLGDLVAVVADDAAEATVAALGGIALVESARMVDDPQSLARFADLLPEAKVAELLNAVAEQDLWHELRPLLRTLPESSIAIAVATAEKLPADRRDRALAEITAVHPH